MVANRNFSKTLWRQLPSSPFSATLTCCYYCDRVVLLAHSWAPCSLLLPWPIRTPHVLYGIPFSEFVPGLTACNRVSLCPHPSSRLSCEESTQGCACLTFPAKLRKSRGDAIILLGCFYFWQGTCEYEYLVTWNVNWSNQSEDPGHSKVRKCILHVHVAHDKKEWCDKFAMWLS